MNTKDVELKTYMRIPANRMTIVAHKLYKSDKVLHFMFLLYRLKKDFGYKLYELANTTGIPPHELEPFYRKRIRTLNREVRNILTSMDYDKEVHAWYLIPDGKHKGLGQGYRYASKYLPEWLKKMKRHQYWSAKPDIIVGQESEKEWNKKLYG